MGKFIITITKIFKFCAGHNLPNYKGVCKNAHGHNYKCYVEVMGKIADEGHTAGMIMDFSDLSNICKEVKKKYDHKWLNDSIPNPTAENIVLYIAQDIAKRLPKRGILIKVTLYETDDSFATIALT